MIYLFGIVLATCFIPGYVGAIIPAQWAVLSIILPLGLWRSGNFGPGLLLGLLALAWAALSTYWAVSYYDSIFGIWVAAIWAGSFWFGYTSTDLRLLWKGLATGLGVSSIIAIIQYLGWSPVESSGGVSGLLYNYTVLGSVSALVLIALVYNHLWFWCLPILPSLYLCHSRGAWVVLLLTFIAYRLPILFIGSISIVALYFTYSTSPSDIQRLIIWSTAARELNFFGYGIGSFITIGYYNSTELYRHATGFFHPEFAHNDYLQLWFELGIGAIPAYAIYAITLSQRNPIFIAFAILGLFWFPLFHPLTAFIGLVAAGRVVADWDMVWMQRNDWGLNHLPWASSKLAGDA